MRGEILFQFRSPRHSNKADIYRTVFEWNIYWLIKYRNLSKQKPMVGKAASCIGRTENNFTLNIYCIRTLDTLLKYVSI